MNSSNELKIIYESDELIAINKPHGLLVHRSRIANDATIFALQLVRDHLGHWVYPVHRLDRKTSGVLLFAKSEKTNSIIQQQFREHQVKKTYKAIVRGYVRESLTIDYPLTENGKTQEAMSHITPLQYFEIPVPFGKFKTSRYSLIQINPSTGRFHQIRKHMKHIFHPILGDRPHGCNKQNKLWKEKFGLSKMMLHARELTFQCSKGKKIKIQATESDEFLRILTILESTHTQNT